MKGESIYNLIGLSKKVLCCFYANSALRLNYRNQSTARSRFHCWLNRVYNCLLCVLNAASLTPMRLIQTVFFLLHSMLDIESRNALDDRQKNFKSTFRVLKALRWFRKSLDDKFHLHQNSDDSQFVVTADRKLCYLKLDTKCLSFREQRRCLHCSRCCEIPHFPNRRFSFLFSSKKSCLRKD